MNREMNRETNRTREVEADLARFVAAARESDGDERFSPERRASILEEALAARGSGTAPAGAAGPFRHGWKLALAWVAPVTLVGLLAVPMVGGPGDANPHGGDLVATIEDATRIDATKDGDRVVFQIANGGAPHRVTRSTVPNRFDPEAARLVTSGAFEDVAQDGARLVFYKID